MDSKAIILELISDVERQMDLRNIKHLNSPDGKLEKLPLDYCGGGAKYKLAKWNAEDGAIYQILIDECYYDGHCLQLELITQEESSWEVTDRYYVRPAKLIEPDDENAHFWNARVPLVVERILHDILIHFHREDIINAKLTIERSWTLEELEFSFYEAFEADLCIFEDTKRIFHDPHRIEEFGTIAGDTLRVSGRDQVGDIVRRMHDTFGITVRIRDRRFGQQPPDILPLYKVRDTPRPQHDMKRLKKGPKK